MMPHHMSKDIKKLVHLLEVTYGDYLRYTTALDALHTLIINDAQSFKPKRTYKKKAANDNAIPKAPRLVGTPVPEKETP
jgi:hypothetical protein